MTTQTGPELVIEKPFGYDLKSVIIYSLWLADIYMRNKSIALTIILVKILSITFSALGLVTFFLNHSGTEYIEEVQIFATETLGCEGRSQYYEGAGVVRDMLQNHMLQVLSLIVDVPCRMNAREIRREKTKVLGVTRLGKKFVTGQYDGYRDEQGVGSDSMTQTFVGW